MCGLQWVEFPEYNGILFRKTYTDLALPSALMDLSHKWLDGTDARWDQINHRWTFPSKATLSFGYLDYEGAEQRYRSAEFQVIGFDEVTEFPESPVVFMFSRLRKPAKSGLPLLMRYATNPGGLGHQWVKQRLIVEGAKYGRTFIPAFLTDNPYVDQPGYVRSLQQLDPVRRKQLLEGSWDAQLGTMFKRDWFRTVEPCEVPLGFRKVRFWDLASTEPEKGKDPDFTAGVLAGLKAGQYYIFDVVHFRGTPKHVEDKIKSRGIDRSKQRDKIRVKGTDVNGVEIVGEAGSGTNVQVFREKKANDVATLNTLAAKYLAELNTISKGAPIEVPIDEGHNLYPGDTVAISNARYNLNDTYRIMRISKYPTKVSFQLEKEKPTLEAKLLDFKKYEDIGIYQISGAGEEINPVVLSYQSLELLIPMDEGSGAFLADYGPYWRQDICYNHTWATGSEGTSLEFAGTGYATCGVDIDLEGLDELTISIWVNPLANGADVNYLVHKENCFSLQHYTTDNKIRFQVYVGGAWHELVTDANAVPLSTRVHVVAKYDGAKMYIYLDNILAKETSQTGSFSDSSNTLYLGAKDSSQGFLTGKIGMLFIFSRALFESEIADLYHYGKISVPPALVSNSIDGQGIQAHYHMNEGQGLVINDSSANENSGTINGATWTDGPTSRFLAFNGSAYVTCGEQLDLGGVGRTKLSLCCWTTLSSHAADENYLFYKEGQYYLQHYGLTDQIRFAVYIGGAWRIITTESHVAPLNERLFVVGVYDGSFLRIYINGTERAKQNQTGALEAAPGAELYLGAKSPTDGGLNGALTECMIWNRYLNRSEVVTLYFFPLTRLMSLGTAGGSMPIRRIYGVCKEYLSRGMGIGCIIPPFTPIETTLRGNDSTSSHCVSDPNPLVESAAYQFGQAVDETSIDRVEAPQFWTNGVLGFNGTGSSSTSIINNIVGSLFTTPAATPTLTQGSAYVLCTTANKTMKMAIYKHSTLAFIVQSTAITVTANASAQRIWFTFPATTLEASTDYIVVVWSSSASGTGALYYAAGSPNQGHTQALTYTTNFPNPMVVGAHNSNKYCCYVGYYY